MGLELWYSNDATEIGICKAGTVQYSCVADERLRLIYNTQLRQHEKSKSNQTGHRRDRPQHCKRVQHIIYRRRTAIECILTILHVALSVAIYPPSRNGHTLIFIIWRNRPSDRHLRL